MSAGPRILVASDNEGDAELVSRLLAGEFDQVTVTTDAHRVAANFDASSPEVLVLAFNGLERAEACYLGLYRLSERIHQLPHRTVALCCSADLDRAYELCRREYIDDYILFWPMPNDSHRLRMAVHHAHRSLAAASIGAVRAADLAEQVRHVAESEEQLQQQMVNGRRQIDRAGHTLQVLERDIGVALDELCGEQEPTGSLPCRIERLKSDQLRRGVQSAADGVDSLRAWSAELQDDLARRRQLMVSLKALAERVPPLVLFVDDDPYQHRLLQRILAAADLDLAVADTPAGAMNLLEQRRPDLILMDVDMPELDGIELTRRIKAHAAWADIPVVMVTGHGNRDVVVRSRQAGAADFVVKPFDRTVLLRKMAECLEDLFG